MRAYHTLNLSVESKMNQINLMNNGKFHFNSTNLWHIRFKISSVRTRGAENIVIVSAILVK